MKFSNIFVIIAFLLNLLLSVQGYYVSLLPRTVPTKPQCCYFTGAGIYFFWQLGCAQYMKENCDIKQLPMITGASAGSLTATFLLAGTDLKFATEKALELAEASKIYERKSGLAGMYIFYASIISRYLIMQYLKIL